jgi:hypothetical protein
VEDKMGVPLAALAIRPPEQQPNMLDQYAKVAQLRQMQQEAPLRQQALQQNVQAGAQDIAIKQQQMKDQEATTAALKSWDGKDVHDLPGLLLKNGGSAQAVFGMKTQMADQQKKLADADEATLKNTQTKNDLVAGHLEAIKQVPPEQKAQAYDAAITDLEQKGVVQPGTIPHQYPGDDKLDLFEKSLMGQKQLFDNAQKERETKAKELDAQAKASQAANATTRLNAEMPGGALQPVEQKELSAYLAAHPGKTAQDFAAWKASLAPQANVNVQMGGGGKGGPLSDTVVDALGAPGAKLKLADVVPARAPIAVKNAAIQQVLSKYPDFKTSDYDIEKGVMKSATSGKMGDNLNSFNTAIEHAKQLDAATDALNNGDIRALNKIGNTLGFETGSDKQTNFNVVKNAVAGEISKVFKGGQATDAEISHVMAPFDAANSPAQLKGAIKQAIALMNSKRDAIKYQIEQGSKGKAATGEDNSTAKPANHPFFESLGGQVRQQ